MSGYIHITDEHRAYLREHHQCIAPYVDLPPHEQPYCVWCSDSWPCGTVLLLDENARLREALKWYAVGRRYSDFEIEWGMSSINNDHGERARRALGMEP